MTLPEKPSSATHLYPQELQLKLYQAFIFSIPILFSIILFLLFYLFYLKRRAATSNPSVSSQHVITRIPRHATPFLPSPCQMSLKGELKGKLPIVLFDEELGRRDTQCCVCLGEFEMDEELLQVPTCKHVFHVDCIHHWLHSNSTCPLCRCSIGTAATVSCLQPQSPPPQPAEAMSAPTLEPPSSSDRSTNDVPNDCSRDISVVIIQVRQQGST